MKNLKSKKKQERKRLLKRSVSILSIRDREIKELTNGRVSRVGHRI